MKAFVINLDRDLHKWKQMQQRYGKMFDLKRFPAINGKTILKQDKKWYNNNMMSGCLASHRALWKQCSEGTENHVIMEDDCMACDEVQLIKILMTLPEDFEVALLGYILSDISGKEVLLSSVMQPVMKRRQKKIINEDWAIAGYAAGAHLYMITPKGAAKMYQYSSTHQYHADVLLNLNRDLILYTAMTPLAIQEKKGFVNYHNVTVEWLLAEPVMALNYDITIRVIHFIILYLALTVCTRSKILVALPAILIARTSIIG